MVAPNGRGRTGRDIYARTYGRTLWAPGTELEDQLAKEYSAAPGEPSGLTFAHVVDALEQCSSVKDRKAKQMCIMQLFARSDAFFAAEPRADKAILHRFALLKLLMPGRAGPVGMKSTMMLYAWAYALGDGPSKVDLIRFIQSPQMDARVRGSAVDDDDDAKEDVVVLPEYAVKRAMGIYANQTGRESPDNSQVSALYVAALAQTLTNRYRKTQQRKLDLFSTSPTYDIIRNNPFSVIKDYINASGAAVLTAILMRTVPIGVTEAVVLDALHEYAYGVLATSNNLAHLAGWSYYMQYRELLSPIQKKDLENYYKIPQNLISEVKVGIPFVPMTCNKLDNLYLMPWIFDRKDLYDSKNPVKPMRGRLVILASGWYIPEASTKERMVYFVEIDKEDANKSTMKAHLPALRKAKQKGLLTAPHEPSRHVIHYRLFKKASSVPLLSKRHEASNMQYEIIITNIENADKYKARTKPSENAVKFVSRSVIMPPRHADADISDENKKAVLLNYTGGAETKTAENVTVTINLEFEAVAVQKKKPAASKRETPTASKSKKPVAQKREKAQAVFRRPTLHRAVKNTEEGSEIRGSSDSELDEQGSDSDASDAPLDTTNSLPSAAKTAETAAKTAETEGIIVQTKYDGDRMQAHIHLVIIRESGRDIPIIEVELFSRKGHATHKIYTDIAATLKRAFAACLDPKAIAPCVLDGEIIVVDEKGDPMAWSDRKWSHDTGFELSLAQPLTGDMQSIVRLIPEDSDGMSLAGLPFANDADDDDANTGIEAGVRTLGDALHEFRDDLNARIIKARRLTGGSLQFVVFDILHVGPVLAVHAQPYKKRLELLTSLFLVLGDMQNVVKLAESHMDVQTVGHMQSLLIKSIESRTEGLILRCPSAQYTFGRSHMINKLKLKGPDINCAIIGGGHCMRTNPRRFGILVAVRNGQSFFSYVRVVFFENNNPSQLMSLIRDANTSVQVSDIKQRLNEKLTRFHLELGLYRVDVKKYSVEYEGGEGALSVQWIPKRSMRVNGRRLRKWTVHFPYGISDDIFYLVAPNDCGCGMSVRGDLRPVDLEMAAKHHAGSPVPVPRFAVGRIEFDMLLEDIDDVSTVVRKLDEDRDARQILQDTMLQYVRRMRRTPARKARLMELHKTLISYLSHATPDGGREKLEWPLGKDISYGEIIDPDVFNADLNEFKALLKLDDLTVPSLSDEERSALLGGYHKSQWSFLKDQGALQAAQEDLHIESVSREVHAHTHAAARSIEEWGFHWPVFSEEKLQ